MFKLAWRNILEHKMRMLLTALGVVLGVSMMLAVSILNESMLKTFEEINLNSGGRADIIVTKNGAFSSQEVKYIKEIESVKFTASMSEDWVRMKLADGEKNWVRIKGIDIKTDKNIRDYYLVEGEWFSGGNKRELIINKKTAGKLGVRSNDIIYLPTNTGEKKYRVAGIIEDKGAGTPYWEPDMFAPIGIITYDSGHSGMYNRIDIDVEDDSMIVPIADKVKKHFGDIVNTQTLTERLAMAKRNMSGMVMGFYVVLAVIIFVGCFLIYNTFMVVVLERIQLIGLLRTIGMDKRQTIRMILVEGVLLGIVGTIIGLGLGLGIGKGLLMVMNESMNFAQIDKFEVSTSNIIAACVIGLIMPIVSCLIPARRASKYQPVEAMKTTDYTSVKQSKKKSFFKKHKTKIGIVLIGIFIINFEILAKLIKDDFILNIAVPLSIPGAFLGVIFVIPPMLKKTVDVVSSMAKRHAGGKTALFTRNLIRNKSRTSITVSIVIIGITMSIGFSGMFNSIRETVASLIDNAMKGDIAISARWDMNYGEGQRLYNAIRKDRDVEDIGYTREEWYQDESKNWLGVIGIKWNEHKALGNFEMVQGDVEDFYERMAEGEKVVVVAEYYTQILGYKIGDTIKLKGRDKKYPFTIVGVINDINGRAAYIDRDNLDDMYGGKLTSDIIVKAVKGADIDALRKKISTDIIKDESISVQTTYEMRETMKQNTMQGTEPFDVINIVTLIVALFGLMNTLLMSILERRREIGMLRSIGSSKLYIRKMVFGESMVMGVFSVIIGTLAGIGFAREANVLMGSMNNIKVELFLPYGFLVTAVIAVLVCAFAAAVYPSHIAVKTGIVDAIKGE